jgi:hypothetical protein
VDFSILYRVLWKPREVFKEFEGKRRLEPFIFIGVMALLLTIKVYRGSFEDVKEHPALLLIGLIQISLSDLMIPIVNATVVYFAIRFALKLKFSFWSLVGIFILCGIPFYIEGAMNVFGYKSIGLGTLSSFLKSTQPFLFGMIATITLFFTWMIYLWWVAINQLFNLQRRQSILLVGSLALINMLQGGLWVFLARMFLSKIAK